MTSNANQQWYVAYTYPQAERKADKNLNRLGVTTFLPLHTVVRQWSDRKKKLEVPLFPNYVFVCTSPQRRFEIFNVKEVVSLVSFEGQPATVSDDTINAIGKMMKGDVDLDQVVDYDEGTAVRISEGQFAGTEGVLVRKNGKKRLVIHVKVLNTYLSVDVSAHHVEAI